MHFFRSKCEFEHAFFRVDSVGEKNLAAAACILPNGGKTTSASVGRKIKSPVDGSSNYEPPNGGKTTSASVGRKIKSPVDVS